MDTLWQDLKYAARTLRRRPAFTLIAVFTLAVGIGGNTAIFTLVHSVLLRPLAYPQSERLVYLGQQWQGGGHSQATTMTKSLFWQRHAEAFEGMTAETGAGYNLAGGSVPERVTGSLVSHDFFRVLGVQPVLGRGFTAEEDNPGGPNVVILTDGVWKRLFGADRGILGRTVRLNERPYEVIGVLPPEFAPERSAGVYVPLRLSERTFDPGTNYGVTARLKPGVTLEQARADAARLFEVFRAEHADHVQRFEVGISVHPLQSLVVGDVRRPLLVLFGAVGLVLLIACANVANLLLARAASRTREIAVRVAMGAGRGRILRQLMCESVAMSVTGGVAGMLLAVWMRDALLAVVPAGLPRVREIALDANVLLFALGLSVVTGVVFGLVSMLQVGRVDLSQSLKEGGERSAGGARRRYVPSALVVAEVSVSLVLLVGASLLMASFAQLRSVGLGFDPENLMTVGLPIGAQGAGTAERVKLFEENVLERVRAIPGVVSATTASSMPLQRGLNHVVSLEGRPDDERHLIEYRAVGPDYFRTLGIPLVKGREFTANDTAGAAQVVIINEQAVQALFPERDPIGGRFAVGKGWGPPGEGPMREVVGVVKDVREIGLDQKVAPTIYVSRAQVPDGLAGQMNQWFFAAILVRTAARADISQALRDAVLAVDSTQPVAQVRWMTDVVAGSVAQQRFQMVLMVSFGAIALLLTVVGVYGVVSYQVARRTQEIGIRMALGASPAGVLRMVLGQGLKLAGIGVAVGLVAAFAGSRLIAKLLFGVKPTDPLVFTAAALLLVGVTLLACWVPARRAARVDPIVALRYE